MVKLNNFKMLAAQWCRQLVAHLVRPTLLLTEGPVGYMKGALSPESRLSIKVFRANGDVEDHGIVCTKLVTDVFANDIVDNLITEVAAFGDYKFHGMGTGIVAENVNDTALGTPVETRQSGTQVEGASTNIYRSVGTITATASRAITEHGLFNIVTAGVLMDRSVFTVINLANLDAIQFTYEITFPSGG